MKALHSPLGKKYFKYQEEGINFAISRQHCLIADEMGLGKFQPLYSKILTPTGWTTMGSLSIGDQVIGSDGTPCKVTGVFPQGLQTSYRLTFRDGTKTECGLDHLWAVKDINRVTKKQPWAVKSLRELIERGVQYKGKTRHAKWQVPLVDPISFSQKAFMIDPYIMGVLIGDGYLCGSSIIFSNPDFDGDIRNFVQSVLPLDYILTESRRNACPSFTIKHIKQPNANPLIREIKRLGLWVKSINKFIPSAYLFGSVEQRKDLLAGLMDTDGSCIKNRTTFHSLSKLLADDVASLVRSLGGVAIVRSYNRKKEGKSLEYQVNVKTNFVPFRTQRKLKQWKKPAFAQAPKKYLVKVEKLDKVSQQCVSVDSFDGLYVTDDYIVTHNTIQAIGVINNTNATNILIICPASVKLNWQRELREWIVDKKFVFIVNSSKSQIPPTDIIIVNYDLIIKPAIFKQLKRIKFDIGIVDEAHALKNPKSQRTKAILSKSGLINNCKRWILLTGTPILNRPIELWPILRVFASKSIEPYTTYTKFANRFCGAYMDNFGLNVSGASNLEDLNARLKDSFMIRRLETEVSSQLPPQRIQHINFSPSKETLKKLEDIEAKNEDSLLGSMASLRQEAALEKLIEARDLIKETITQVPKLVIFFHHKKVKAELEKIIGEVGADSVALDGSTPAHARLAIIENFINEEKTKVFLGQIQAAGQGIDGLQNVCSHVLFAELAWTPGEVEQCIKRVHRWGQKHPVLIQFLIWENSIEEQMLKSIRYKSKNINTILKQEVGMSIEKNLERIATMMEKLVDLVADKNPEPKVQKVSKKKVSKKKDEKVEDAEVVENPLANQVGKVIYTLEDVRKSLASYAKDHGKDETIALMIRHGADKSKPTVSSIPPENYAGIIEG